MTKQEQKTIYEVLNIKYEQLLTAKREDAQKAEDIYSGCLIMAVELLGDKAVLLKRHNGKHTINQ